MKSKDRFIPIAMTIFLLGGVIWWTQRGFSPETKAQSPESTIWRMVEACRAGETMGYLNCFEGEIKKRLTKLAEERGKVAFQNQLKRLMGSVKGVALSPPEETLGEEVLIKVEYMLSDRSEWQLYRLRKAGRLWKVVRVETAQRVPTLIPYGAKIR